MYAHTSSTFFLCLECGCDPRAEVAILDICLRDARHILRLWGTTEEIWGLDDYLEPLTNSVLDWLRV